MDWISGNSLPVYKSSPYFFLYLRNEEKLLKCKNFVRKVSIQHKWVTLIKFSRNPKLPVYFFKWFTVIKFSGNSK